MALPQLDIEHVSPEERIRLAEELWDSLGETPYETPLTPAQAQELDRRLASYRDDGEPGEPWRDALDRIGQPRGMTRPCSLRRGRSRPWSPAR